MRRHSVVFLTRRAEVHQQEALRGAPSALEVKMVSDPNPEQVRAALRKAEFVISERDVGIDAAAVSAAEQLRLIVRLGSLAHDIDLVEAKKKQIRISLQPVMTSVIAAEHVSMMILALTKKLVRSMMGMYSPTTKPTRPTTENVFAYDWARIENVDRLAGKTIAILGMGEIGVELSRRLRPFRPATLLYDKRTPYPPAVEASLGVTHAPRERCVRDAEVVVSLLPYSKETAHAIDATALQQMKPGALLVHAGSGGVVNERALIEALSSKRLGGAALDTYEAEPLPIEHPLHVIARDPAANLILTPHVASGTNAYDRREDFGEIVRLLEKRPLAYEIT